ncbi:terminase small subunit [Hazenella sp. IB182353]|uniref:terminase small subunit n=1 Tax=Polycladospora coralii TaxID=2771432 RepID=UPI001746DDB2|nr:terminase small subunit [Polycladospora coralii]MBS7529986.1 terminase small subunit [Polycladospora coralii]
MTRLTPKQQAFVKAYLVDLYTTQAAIRAGYNTKTADRIGAENLRKPQIETTIQQALDEHEARTEVTADMVLKQ